MTREIENILVDGNIYWTGEDIEKRLDAAGYVIVPKNQSLITAREARVLAVAIALGAIIGALLH